MKPEIEQYFNNLGAETEKLVKKCPHKTDRDRIEAAKNEVYKRRHEIDDIMVIREVWKETNNKDLKIMKHEYEADQIRDLKKQIVNYQELAFIGWLLVGSFGVSCILIYLHKLGVL